MNLTGTILCCTCFITVNKTSYLILSIVSYIIFVHNCKYFGITCRNWQISVFSVKPYYLLQFVCKIYINICSCCTKFAMICIYLLITVNLINHLHCIIIFCKYLHWRLLNNIISSYCFPTFPKDNEK